MFNFTANMTQLTQSNEDLPEIKEGDPCTPGLSYKMDCNHCQCTNKNVLICTKMACGSPENLSNFINKAKEAKKDKLRSRYSLSVLPNGKCVPGRTYKSTCRRCFCNNLGKASCSLDKNGACKTFKDGKVYIHLNL